MSRRDGLTKEEARIVKGAFSGWKLDVVKAMVGDKDLIPSDVRIGIALLQHLNSQTWLIFPSHETLAEITHMTPRNVIKCLERLRTTGWLRWVRGARQRANEYEFDSQKVADAIAQMKTVEAERKKRKQERRDMNSSSYQSPSSVGTGVHTEIRTPVHPNTLNRTGRPRKEATK